MSENDASYTLSILTERESGALVRLTMALARHRIAIDSLTTTTEDSGVYRHVIGVTAAPDRVRRAMKQIEAAVGVLTGEYFAGGETVDREVALFKVDVGGIQEGDALRELVRARRARVLVQSGDYVIIEKTGYGQEIVEFSGSLRPFGVIEYVRSGRVMVTRTGPAELTGARGPRARFGSRTNGDEVDNG
jgi:acetolactate synthase I/III small subunit